MKRQNAWIYHNSFNAELMETDWIIKDLSENHEDILQTDPLK